MIVLAIDCSSPVCSLALTRGETVLGTRAWDADGRSRQQLFPHLESLLRDAGVTADPVSRRCCTRRSRRGAAATVRLSRSS